MFPALLHLIGLFRSQWSIWIKCYCRMNIRVFLLQFLSHGKFLHKFIELFLNNTLLVPLRFQCFVTCLICIILGNIGEMSRKNVLKYTFFEEFPLVRYRPISGIAVLPLSIVFVGMIAFNNLCLQYVEVSFCKSVKIRISPPLPSNPTLYLPLL